jgi:hypothetical protein
MKSNGHFVKLVGSTLESSCKVDIGIFGCFSIGIVYWLAFLPSGASLLTVHQLLLQEATGYKPGVCNTIRFQVTLSFTSDMSIK